VAEKRLKLLYLCDLNLRNGGAQRITFNTLECLSKEFDIVVYMTTLPSQESLDLIKRLGLETAIDLSFDLDRFKNFIVARGVEIILIQWESGYWIQGVHRISKELGTKYVILVHELPIVGTPVNKVFTNWFVLSLWTYIKRAFERIAFRQNAYDNTTSGNIDTGSTVSEKRAELHPFKFKLLLDAAINLKGLYKGMKCATKIIAMGPASKFYIDRYLGFNNVLYVEHNAAPDIFPAGDLSHSKDLAYDLTFMAARLERRKGIFDFLKVVYDVKTSLGKDVRAIMLGRFIDERTQYLFKREIKKLNLDQNVEMPGFVSEQEKSRIICSSKVFVYPSVKDVFSISLLDALSCGCPAVVYDLPFTYNFNTVGLIRVKYKETHVISKKVIELLLMSDEKWDEYKQLRWRIKSEVAANFSWELTCRDQINAISAAIADIEMH
jgi:glycosyltransferase involved in cell wall biosynthesis